MIAERLPQLAAMTREEKWEVLHELKEELYREIAGDDDPHLNDPETRTAIDELLAARRTYYRLHPKTARPWHEVRAELQQRFRELKIARQRIA